MQSFEELRKGGRYTMRAKYSKKAYPVSVKQHPYESNATIVKYLNNESRGSMMALYSDQIKRNVCVFVKNSKDLPPYEPPPHPQSALQSTPHSTRYSITCILTLINTIMMFVYLYDVYTEQREKLKFTPA
jgi:hypothetical protein